MPTPEQLKQKIALLEAELGPRTLEPDCSGLPTVEPSFTLNGKDYTLNIPQDAKDMLDETLDALKNKKNSNLYTSNEETAQLLLDHFLAKFTDNDSAILFSKALNSCFLGLPSPKGIPYTNPKEIKDTPEYIVADYMTRLTNVRSAGQLFSHFKEVVDCDFLKDLNLRQNIFNVLWENAYNLPKVSEYLSQIPEKKERTKLLNYIFESFAEPEVRRTNEDEPSPFNIAPFSSPNITEDMRIASLAAFHGYNFHLAGATKVITELLRDGKTEIDDYNITEYSDLPPSCFHDGGLFLDGLRERYHGSTQEAIDNAVNTIRKKNSDQDVFNNLQLIREGVEHGCYSESEGLEILQAIAKCKSSDDVYYVSETLGHRGIYRKDRNCTVLKALHRLPVKEHLRVYNEYYDLMEKSDDELSKIKLNIGCLSLTGTEVQQLEIFDATANLFNGSNAPTALAEMLIDATNDPDKATIFKQTINYISNQLSCGLLTKGISIQMLDLVIEDIYQGINLEYLKGVKGDSIEEYIDRICNDIPSQQLEVIKGICSHIEDPTTAAITRYCLAIFAKRGVNVDETLSNLLGFIESAASNNIVIESNDRLQDLNAQILVASIAREISHPGLIRQFGPTCDPTSAEYVLCIYKPERYVSFLAQVFNDLCEDPKSYNLEPTEEDFPYVDKANISMHLFQTLLYNELVKYHKQIQEESEDNSEEEDDVYWYGDFSEEELLAEIQYPTFPDFMLDFIEKNGFSVEKIYEQADYSECERMITYASIDDSEERHYEDILSEHKEQSIKEAFDKIDMALAEGAFVRIAYLHSFVWSSSHAAIIVGANYDASGKVESYKLYHGHSNFNKGGHEEKMPLKQLKETLLQAAKIRPDVMDQKPQ